MRLSRAVAAICVLLVSAAALQDSGLLARLAAHPTLAKLTFVERSDAAPVALLFQKPAGNYPKNFEAELAKARAPWLTRVVDDFRTKYAEPGKLQRRADRARPAMVVLWEAADFARYQPNSNEPNGFGELAHYDRRLGAVVTFEYVAPVLPANWRRWPELAELVRGELDAYAVTPETRLPHWVVEGLSAYLAAHDGPDPGALERHVLESTSLDKLVAACKDPDTRKFAILPLNALFEPKSFDEQRVTLLRQAGVTTQKKVKPRDLLEIVRTQAWTLVHFMHEGENGKSKAGFTSYLQAALRGEGSDLAAFKKALAVDVDALDAAYIKWLFAEQAKRAATAVARAAGKPNAAFDPKSLALSDDDPAQIAAVLPLARQGRLGDAIAKLEELRKNPKLASQSARIDTELMRCQKFLALRDKHFGGLAASGAKFTFEADGKKVTTKIKGVAEGKLYLEENKAKVASIAIASLDQAEVARAFAKELAESPDGWARWYPSALAGDVKALKSAKAPQELVDLKADAESWYPEAMHQGEGLALIQSLAELGEPKDAAAATSCYATLQRLGAEFGSFAPVKARSAPLQALATAALRKLWGVEKLGEATAAKVDQLGDGRVRLTYAFDKKEEGAEFTPDHEYFSSWRTSLRNRSTAGEAALSLGQGSLRASGAGCWRLAWNFEAPLKVQYTVGFESVEADASNAPVFAWGVCDDKRESFVWCQGFGSLYANSVHHAYTKSDAVQEARPVDAGGWYPIELEVGGGKAITRDGETQVKQLDDVPHKGGGMFLFVHSEQPLLLDGLVIEGKPELQAFEQAWIARKLSELKL